MEFCHLELELKYYGCNKEVAALYSDHQTLVQLCMYMYMYITGMYMYMYTVCIIMYTVCIIMYMHTPLSAVTLLDKCIAIILYTCRMVVLSPKGVPIWLENKRVHIHTSQP